MSKYHTPVLAVQAIDLLRVEPGKQYIDATIGGGGHAQEIVRLGGRLLGLDVDRDAVSEAKSVLGQLPGVSKNQWQVAQGNFRNLADIAQKNGFSDVSGVLFDLGTSSYQVDQPERGFSFRNPRSPLDMRLDQKQALWASELVNRESEEELYEIFERYGEEKLARPIAHATVVARAVAPIKTSGQFRNIVASVAGRSQNIEPTLARIYQSLRIVVNDELEALKEGLRGAEEVLIPGGRLVVISFHSLEDRIVKLFLKSNDWKMVTKKPILPERSEIRLNSRARSAKLRAAEKI